MWGLLVLGSSPAWHTGDISQLVSELAGLQLHDGRVAAAAVQAEDVLRCRGRADGSRAKQASDTHGEQPGQAVGRRENLNASCWRRGTSNEHLAACCARCRFAISEYLRCRET